MAIVPRFRGATLFRNSRIVKMRLVISAVFHNLCYCGHLVFTAYLNLARHVDQPLEGDLTAELGNINGLIDRAKSNLAAMPFTPGQ